METKDEAPATLRETLEENIAAIRERDETPIDAAPETTEQKADRVRDESGRFAKESATEQKPSVAVSPAADLSPATVADTLPAIQRPSAWKKDMWPVWDKLNTGAALTPQEARQLAEYNAQREQQFASGVSTYKQEAERAKPILEAIAPFQADLDRFNIPAPQMVHSLMAAHQKLSLGSAGDKLQMFAKLANDYGIPIQALYDQGAQQQYLSTAPAAQPTPQPQPDINSLVESALQQREVKQTITSMEKDSQKYPFFPYVRQTMAQLLEQGVSTDLDVLYHTALEAPEHSMLTQAMQQQQTQADEQRRIEQQRATVAVARRNSISPKSSTPTTGAVTNSKPSVRDALRESLAAHLGSARV